MRELIVCNGRADTEQSGSVTGDQGHSWPGYEMDIPGLVSTTSNCGEAGERRGERRLVTEPQKLHRKIKENRITPESLREHCRQIELPSIFVNVL